MIEMRFRNSVYRKALKFLYWTYKGSPSGAEVVGLRDLIIFSPDRWWKNEGVPKPNVCEAHHAAQVFKNCGERRILNTRDEIEQLLPRG